MYNTLGRKTGGSQARSRSGSMDGQEGDKQDEPSNVAAAYATIHIPSSFSPNHPRNYRPVQVFLHNCWARSNYEMDFEEEELPSENFGNLTFSSMYRRI